MTINNIQARDRVDVGRIDSNLVNGVLPLLGQVNVAGDDGDAFNGEILQRSSDTDRILITVRRSRGSSVVKTNIVNGDVLGQVLSSGFSGATGWWDAASIRFVCEDVVVDNQRPASGIEFLVGPANTAPARVFHVTALSTAVVGIGTANANPAVGDETHPHIFEVINDNTANQLVSVSTYGPAGALHFENNVHFNRYRGTLAAPTAILNGDTILGMGFRGAYFDVSLGRVALSQSAASYQVFAIEDWTDTAQGCREQWEVTAVGTTGRVHIMELHSFGLSLVNTGVIRTYGLGAPFAAAYSVFQIQHDGTVCDIASTGNNAGNTKDIRIRIGPPTGTEFFRFTTAGNFGIGNVGPSGGPTNFYPQALLHVGSNTAATGRFEQSSTDAVPPLLDMYKVRGVFGTPANVSYTSANVSDEIFRLQGNAYSGGYLSTGYISSMVDAAVVNTQRPASRLSFWINPNNGIAVERMRLSSSGQLGLGAVDLIPPAALFHMVSSVNVTIKEQVSTDTVPALLAFRKARFVGSVLSQVAQGDVVIRIQGVGYSTGYQSMGKIDMIVDAATVAGQAPASAWEFYTNANNAAAVLSFRLDNLGGARILANTATVAGGAANGVLLGSASQVGVFFGSGAPTISSPKGSLYLRTDGAGATSRMYVATDAVGTWTAVTTVL
jgi:hypothetical protein